MVYCGYQIAAGTRHELPGEEGMAHFCEHMTFKGTRTRNALQIINSLEQLGGDLNAFTNKEDTTFYAAIQKEHIAKTVSLLTDIVFNSTYPQHEIDKEVEVLDADGMKYKGTLLRVEEPQFTILTQEKQKQEGKKRPVLASVERTFSMDEVKYCKYLIDFK